MKQNVNIDVSKDSPIDANSSVRIYNYYCWGSISCGSERGNQIGSNRPFHYSNLKFKHYSNYCLRIEHCSKCLAAWSPVDSVFDKLSVPILHETTDFYRIIWHYLVSTINVYARQPDTVSYTTIFILNVCLPFIRRINPLDHSAHFKCVLAI
jgi:hypothetical protein